MDIELIATVFTAPQKCPRCGSMHTMPLFPHFIDPFTKKFGRILTKQIKRELQFDNEVARLLWNI